MFFLLATLILTFQDLEQINQKNSSYKEEVEITGFLQKSPKGFWILSNEPNLKSCCVASPKKIWNQIILDKTFLSSDQSHAVTLKGQLSYDPKYNLQGEIEQVYTMSDIELIKEQAIPWKTLSSVAAIALGVFLLISKRKLGGRGDKFNKVYR